ncbi:MAG: DEAD/DEAH box helicase family protein [Chloroflexi bacterium]|nr:DEAD/DEAH box helicase family protein [Chloroflexota bacterium]
MRPEVNAIAGRLSLRPPQRQSLEILDRITELADLRKGADVQSALAAIRSEYPGVTDFEREFPSLCFSLATGVGKTRLMGAFIAYLHLAHRMDNFFVLAPSLTIYNKLIADFTPGTPKYVFRGIAAFAVQRPEIITGENYNNAMVAHQTNCKINIFNISKINSEVRGGRSPRIRALSEYIGQSYFDYLAALPDLVLLMDESHRYRAGAGVRAINELKPVLGLELTATPYVETARGTLPFKNVILNYPLGKAMEDGFVKDPAVVTLKDFNPAGMTAEQIELVKLEDGIRLHEHTKVELETYARENGVAIVKPFVLVIARDTTHAAQLVERIKADAFFEGSYREKVIQVDSSTSGEDAVVERLLRVEQRDEPTEIVIHVNMLKEGWDVTNLYTIIPLRAAHARVLIEQSIGRGLRLPYGKRTGVPGVDRLSIVAHDRFQEMVDEAKRPDSVVRLTVIELNAGDLASRPHTVVAQPNLATSLGFQPPQLSSQTEVAKTKDPPPFATEQEQQVAQLAYQAMQRLAAEPQTVPGVSYFSRPDVQERLVREVAAAYRPAQGELPGLRGQPDIAAVVAKTASLVIGLTIDIPRILVAPQGDVQAGFHPFTLDLTGMRYQPLSDELWVQNLRTGAIEAVGVGRGGAREARPEDYIVGGLIGFDDVAYAGNADLLYDLAGQTVRHLHTYLSEEQTERVLSVHQREIARFIHVQMQEHAWEEAVAYETIVSQGFGELRATAFSQTEPTMDFRVSPADKSNMAKYLFGGFAHCLYPVQKFQSDPERILAVILDREAEKWFRPATGQFRIFYRLGADHPEYQPDFVAETAEGVFMLEVKRRSEMQDAVVLAKSDAAAIWCRRASAHAAGYGGKSWTYALIPHDAIAENMTIDGLVRRWSVAAPD